VDVVPGGFPRDAVQSERETQGRMRIQQMIVEQGNRAQ